MKDFICTIIAGVIVGVLIVITLRYFNVSEFSVGLWAGTFQALTSFIIADYRRKSKKESKKKTL